MATSETPLLGGDSNVTKKTAFWTKSKIIILSVVLALVVAISFASAGSVKFSWVITTEKGESNFKRNLEGELVNAGFADVIVVNGGYKAVSVIAPVGPIIELFEKSKDFERVGGVGAAHNHGYEVGYNSIRLPNVIHEATLFETPSAASYVKYLQKPEQLRSCIKDYIKEQRQKRQYCERD